MERALKCLRCGADMEFLKRQHIQLGVQEFSFFRGDHWDHLEAGGLFCEMYVCPQCKKLEFFQGDESEGVYDPQSDLSPEENPFRSVSCPECGRSHHEDLTACPFCGHKYPGAETEEAPRGETAGREEQPPREEKKRKKERRPPWEFK